MNNFKKKINDRLIVEFDDWRDTSDDDLRYPIKLSFITKDGYYSVSNTELHLTDSEYQELRSFFSTILTVKEEKRFTTQHDGGSYDAL